MNGLIQDRLCVPHLLERLEARSVACALGCKYSGRRRSSATLFLKLAPTAASLPLHHLPNESGWLSASLRSRLSRARETECASLTHRERRIPRSPRNEGAAPHPQLSDGLLSMIV
jgi:hypothetical protein